MFGRNDYPLLLRHLHYSRSPSVLQTLRQRSPQETHTLPSDTATTTLSPELIVRQVHPHDMLSGMLLEEAVVLAALPCHSV